jgi:hypothetical protein
MRRRIAEGGRKKLHQLHRCSEFILSDAAFPGQSKALPRPSLRAVRLLHDKGTARHRLKVGSPGLAAVASALFQ